LLFWESLLIAYLNANNFMKRIYIITKHIYQIISLYDLILKINLKYKTNVNQF
jgi:hypothetical protein